MNITTVSSKRQITLSAQELQILGMKPSDKFIKYIENNEIHLKPIKQTVVQSVGGSLAKLVQPAQKGVTLEHIMKKTQKTVAKKKALGI